MPTLLATHMRELSKAIVFPPHHGPLPPRAHGGATASPWCRTSTTRRRPWACSSARASPVSSRPSSSRTRSAGASPSRSSSSWPSTRLGLAPAEALFVGDRIDIDVAGAQGVGMASAWINPDAGGAAPRRPAARLRDSRPGRARAHSRHPVGPGAHHIGSHRPRRHRVATTRKVIIIGSGPAGLHRGHLRGPRQPLAGHVHGSAVGRPAHADHAGRELPGLRRRHRRAAADGDLREAGAALRHRDVRRGRDEGRLQPAPVHGQLGRHRRSRRTPSSSPPAPRRSSSASPNESKLMGRGVSTCATCDGFFFKDQNIMVVGGGDTAIEEALYLSRLGRKVEVVHRRDTLRASKIMQERALKNPKISFIWDSVVDDVLDPAQGKVTGVRLRNLKTGAQWETAGRRPLRGHRASAEHGASSRARSTCTRTSTSRSCPAPPDVGARRLRRGRRAGLHVSPGGDGGGHGLHGGARGRALPRSAPPRPLT